MQTTGINCSFHSQRIASCYNTCKQCLSMLGPIRRAGICNYIKLLFVLGQNV